MSLLKHKVLRHRSAPLPFSGSAVESDPTPTATSLAQDPAAVADPSSTPTGIPLVSSATGIGSITAVLPSTSTASAASSASSSNQIPLGTVIGACIAAVVALLLAVLLAFYCSRRQKQFVAHSKSRNASSNFFRRRSHLEPWKRMADDGDQRERRERHMRQRPSSGPLGTMFQRTNSNTSGEKSSEGHTGESVGTMQHFAKYHPGLAAEMASQGDIMGVDGRVAKPPPVHQPVGRGLDMSPPMSLDEETVGGHSLVSLHSGLSSPRSPLMMATAKSTPPATTTSSLHRWESAEVVHVSETGSEYSEAGELRNPFEDNASTIRGSGRVQNPFFSARDHPVRRRTLLPDTNKNPFADSPSPNDSSAAAIQSLIAALEEPEGNGCQDRITSVQSSVYSRMTGDDDSAISVTAFPYPPTQINLS